LEAALVNLREALDASNRQGRAIGHFNVSDLVTIKAIFETARSLGGPGGQIPVIIGASEGERAFIGAFEIADFIRFLRNHYGYPIFVNADHTHTLDRVKEAVAAGFDEILIDGSALSFDANIALTREAVSYIRQRNPEIVVEGEIGSIGSGSVVRDRIPEGVALTPDSITKPEEALNFVKATGVDMFAPAVGNIHGMLRDVPDPHLFIDRITEIKNAIGIPMVLHGGSGTPDQDFVGAIDAGISVIHISTELRRAWRRGVEAGLRRFPDEVTPFKLMGPAYTEISEVVANRLKLFNKLE
jgi:fructose-bisphosphate aldolase class II